MKNNSRYKKIGSGIIIFVIVMSLPLSSVFALKNPSAVYCKEMGYEYIIEENKAGQTGVCKFSEAENCNAWEFLTGKCGKEHSYCKKEGYGLKTISDSEKCSTIPFSPECAVCVLEDGKEIEVTKLMELNFEEGICGDSKCVLGENYENCSQDCPSGSADSYCDGLQDNICDPDCKVEEDLDCKIGANVDICADENCFGEKEIFTEDEAVYIKVDSKIPILNIQSTIKTPSGEIKNIAFENNLVIFKSNEIGSFSLWVNLIVNLPKEGYQKIKIEKTFAYIEKPAEIPSASICNEDGKCSGDENEQNCPQDCLGEKKTNVGLVALTVGIVLGGLGIIIYRKMRRKKQSSF